MRLLVFLALLSSTAAWAQKTPTETVKTALDKIQSTGLPPSCPTCAADVGGGYGLDAVLSDLRSGRLRYIGREDGDGYEGGNWSCFYGNEQVYVVLEGCRPNRLTRPQAFRMQIIRRDGTFLDIYADSENDPYDVAQPTNNVTWSLMRRQAQPLAPGMSAVQLRDYIVATGSSYNQPLCSATANSRPTCNNGGVSDVATIQQDARNPGNRVQLIHDLVTAVAR